MSAPEQITFIASRVQVGQVTLRTSEEETKMVFAPPGPDGQPAPVLTGSRVRHVRREEVVAVREGVVERLRVTFIEEVSTVDTGDQSERTVGPLSGSTFEVERKSENVAVAVFDASGAPARFGVAAQVSGQYRHFGRMPATEVELPVGPQRVGQSSPEFAEGLVAGVSRGAAISAVDVAKATLTEIVVGPEGANHGKYRVDLKVSAAANGSKITMALHGTVVLRDVDGAVLEVILQGSVTSVPEPAADGSVDPQIPSGAGEFKLTQTMVYAQA